MVFKVAIIALGLFLSLVILNLNSVNTTILKAAGGHCYAVCFELQGKLLNTSAGVIINLIPKFQIGD